MNSKEQEIKNELNGTQITNSTALAAALTNLGFQLKKNQSLVRVYTKNAPIGTLGIFHFLLDQASKEGYVKDNSKLRVEFFSPNSDKELDELIKKISQRLSDASSASPENAKLICGEIQQLFARLVETMPYALMAVMGGMHKNHLAIRAKMKEICAKPDGARQIVETKTGKKINIPAGLDKETAKSMIEKLV